MNLGAAIKFCRQQRNLTQPALAVRADVSASYLSVLEQGKRDPSFSVLQKIARALDVPLSLLIFVAFDEKLFMDNDGLPTTRAGHTYFSLVGVISREGGSLAHPRAPVGRIHCRSDYE